MLEARTKNIVLLERRGSDLYFKALHVQILIQQNILGAMKLILKNAGGGWQLLKRNAGRERVKCNLSSCTAYKSVNFNL